MSANDRNLSWGPTRGRRRERSGIRGTCSASRARASRAFLAHGEALNDAWSKIRRGEFGFETAVKSWARVAENYFAIGMATQVEVQGSFRGPPGKRSPFPKPASRNCFSRLLIFGIEECLEKDARLTSVCFSGRPGPRGPCLHRGADGDGRTRRVPPERRSRRQPGRINADWHHPPRRRWFDSAVVDRLDSCRRLIGPQSPHREASGHHPLPYDCRVPDAILIDGANGDTLGRLATAASALQRGIRPVLGGRREASLADLAGNYGLGYRAAGVDDAAALYLDAERRRRPPECGGPVFDTWAPLVEACLRCGVHYLDLASEVSVFERVRARGADASRRGGSCCCPAWASTWYLGLPRGTRRRAPAGAHALRIAVSGLELVSRGSARTLAEQVGRAPFVRAGQLVTIPAGSSNGISTTAPDRRRAWR